MVSSCLDSWLDILMRLLSRHLERLKPSLIEGFDMFLSRILFEGILASTQSDSPHFMLMLTDNSVADSGLRSGS